MTFGLTDTLRPSFDHYVEWLTRLMPGAVAVRLSHLLDNTDELHRCDALILTGGGDIDSSFYGREDAAAVLKDVVRERDEFELEITRRALELHLPILGICRGLQLFNVAMGGSLVPDVQTAGYNDHGKGTDSARAHQISIKAGSLLYSIAGSTSGSVNTNHHQAVDRIGAGLSVTSRSDDGLVESLEWENREGRPFLLLVQWHPERMIDHANRLATGILERFIVEGAKRVGIEENVIQQSSFIDD